MWRDGGHPEAGRSPFRDIDPQSPWREIDLFLSYFYISYRSLKRLVAPGADTGGLILETGRPGHRKTETSNVRDAEEGEMRMATGAGSLGLVQMS